MEFCEKCGALMLPTKKQDGKKPVLKCRECGHEKRLGSSEYKVEQKVQHTPKEKIVVIEESETRKDDLTEDERRERRKAILEHFDSED